MIELQNLSFEVHETNNGSDTIAVRSIISDISFTFESGKIYAVTGPNGSGKSTLAKLIMGIHASSRGMIRFMDEDITGMAIDERSRAGIAYGFQHPARFKGTTFRDLLAIASGQDDEDTLARIISRVGICSMDFLDKPVDAKLSGGEIKKIEMATIIARNPKLAIYDEPDTGIDLWTIQPMVDLIRRENRKNNATTIVVSHNRAFLEAADTLLLIKDGKIAYTGDMDGAESMLDDQGVCTLNDLCREENNAECYR
nr:ATP-binding cassette domain-containing protein [uncultured Desulfobacter sp.]